MTTRRRFLATSALTIPALASGASPTARILDLQVIPQQPGSYHAWPTLTRCRSGQLWLAWSGGREAHVCPFGQVHAMTSFDDGQSWTWPRVLLDSASDDRDAGVLETAKGTLLVTSFTSQAWLPGFDRMKKQEPGAAGEPGMEKHARWQAAYARLTDGERATDTGQWVIRSTDSGKSWSSRIPTVVNSPHGPIALQDGRLLYAGKQLWTNEKEIGVAQSTDDGLSWQWLAPIPGRPGDKVLDGYHELHAVETAEGRIIVHIRNHNEPNGQETLQTESGDGGKTWSLPHSIGVWGLPSHLLRLRDGRLLMTYGHRRKPLGNQARISSDHGRTWGEAIPLSTDGTSGDLGYPSTVELSDGTLLTVWYEKMKTHPFAVLRQARWTLS